MDIPVIETERLILRAYAPTDFDAFAAMWADPDVVHFIGGRVFTREQSWQRFLTRAGGWQHLGFGFFATFEKESGQLVGEAGFHASAGASRTSRRHDSTAARASRTISRKSASP